MSAPFWQHELFAEIAPHIVRKFVVFHRDNPHVYVAFKRFANEAKNSGRTRFGAKMIYERMRWFTMIETNDQEFKLSNDFHSCYARLMMIEDPFFLNLFRRKTTKKFEYV